MGKRFHKNSVYILILRLSILFFDLIGINIIFGSLVWMYGVENFTQHLGHSLTFIHVILTLTWFFPSFYFKTYEGNLKIAYNLKNSIYQFFVHLLIFLLFFGIFHQYIHFSKFYIYYSIVSLVYLPFCRYGIAFYLNKIDNIIPLRKRVTIIGNNQLLNNIQHFLEAEHSGCRLLKLNYHQSAKMSNLDYLRNSIELAKSNNINEIYSFVSPDNEGDYRLLISTAEKHFIKLRFIKDFSNHTNEKLEINTESDIPLKETFKAPLEELDNRIRKRLFDVLISLFVIIFILSWLWPIIALLIKIESKGQVLFKQKRTGRINQTFVCYKFRTMIVNEFSETQQAIPNDHRFTRIGKLLRKTNLDELPQFINVLKGEMSVIGPRPHMLHHTEEYEDCVESYMQRHFIKPGISGWAQINGFRGNLDQKMMEVRVQFDLEYIKNWNFWIDLDILIKTIILTVTGDENAY